MRVLVQPGPVHPRRIDSLCGEPQSLTYTLEPGMTLNDALTAPLVAAGMQSGTVTFGGGTLAPFSYVMPGPADSADHVAYFSASRTPVGDTQVELANATFGWHEGKPSVHIHGAWREADGSRRGGHMLPHECIVATAMSARAWGFVNIRIETTADPETNFTLFRPDGHSIDGARGIAARVRPNQDITHAVEEIARRHDISNAVIRGSLGSLIGARFADGHSVTDHATEVLVRSGHVRDGVAALEMLAVDMQGRVHEGLLVPGENPVLITFDLLLEAVR